ncbi:MAG: GGDEF domain-containing protein [Desulfovibrio sp.]|jgi:diguanylate cyclase (GGDEF)-like protein|nr:GGDEF domain-containing protein [Desulfovibrio sp.]
MEFIKVIFRLLLVGGWAKHRRLFLALGAGTCLIVGWIDYVTTDEINLSFVYLAPVFFTTIAAGRTGGVVMALVCSVVKVMTDVYSDQPYAQSVFYLFNGLGLFLAFAGFALLLDMLRQAYRRECDTNSTDELTGLPNRLTFAQSAGKAWERSREVDAPCSLVVVDIDNFKAFNQSQGEHVGDVVLQTLARAAGLAVGEQGPVYRVGGDDFVVVLPAHDGQEARLVAEALQEGLMRAVRERKWRLSVSCCVVLLGCGTQDLDAALHMARTALYGAKHSGESGVLVEAGA